MGAARQRIDPEYRAALKNFEAAARHFNHQSYAKAKGLFEKLLGSPVAEVAERARVHLRICEKRLERSPLTPKTSEEYYNLGVAELNTRRLDTAIQHLSKAAKAAPGREEIRYALAAAHALQGNRETALEHLSAAIALRPQNKFQARQDLDFESLTDDPRFQKLVSPVSGTAY